MQDALPTSFGAYRVVRLLGRGGMGEVYEVEHPQLGVHYALKAFARDAAAADALRARFLAEGRLSRGSTIRASCACTTSRWTPRRGVRIS